MQSRITNVDTAPDLAIPGAESTPKRFARFLGEEGGPWIYYTERPAGDVVPRHSHKSGRHEFVIAGEIEWDEPDREPVTYGAGTLTFVDAGTVYGYRVIRDVSILIWFDGDPGIQYV